VARPEAVEIVLAVGAIEAVGVIRAVGAVGGLGCRLITSRKAAGALGRTPGDCHRLRTLLGGIKLMDEYRAIDLGIAR
jgi:hypothetical protein